MTAESRVIAEFSDYSGLHAALRSCRELRNISFETLDEIVGAPKGYFSKVFAPRSQRKITMQSLGWALAGLGVKCQIVDDPDALKQIANRLKGRDLRVVRSKAVHFVLDTKFLRKIGRQGGKNSRMNLGKRHASQIGRNAALIRWSRERQAKRK